MIVVDNASSDGSAEMVKIEFPIVKLIQLEKNIGIAGWNEGFKVAKGEYVLVLDDDSYPDAGTIQRGVEKFCYSESIAIVAFNVIDKSRNVSQTAHYKKPYLDFVGCGAIVKKSVFSLIGGFDDSIFIFVHELDFSIQVLSAGYTIEYIPDALVFHRTITKTNTHPINNGYRFYYQSVSYIILLRKYLNKISYQTVMLKFLINRLLVAIYFGRIKEYLAIIKYPLFNNSASHYKNRVPIKTEILKLYNNLNIEIFSRVYFGGLLKNRTKIMFPFKYISTVFLPIEDKNQFIV